MKRVGIVKEVMQGEGRVALTPRDCNQLVKQGVDVQVEQDAGYNSGYSNDDYQQAGAKVLPDAASLYAASDLVVKVKQPLAHDLQYLTARHIVFSYMHLAADPGLVEQLCTIGLTAVPFESVRDDRGKLPLLAPMSQIAGRISVLRGASLLFRNRGGRGILIGGVEGTDRGNVVVLGAGVAGRYAVDVAVALGANVTVVDLNEDKLEKLKQQYPGISTRVSTEQVVADLCISADIVVGAVLLAGRRAPVILKKSVIAGMNEGSVIVDIAIDQGGCVEGIRVTDADELCYTSQGVIHSAVPNMPAAVSRTASQSLSSAILPYVEKLAMDDGLSADNADLLTQRLAEAVAVSGGNIVDPVLKQELGG
jgi:alanine dehydrogenase